MKKNAICLTLLTFFILSFTGVSAQISFAPRFDIAAGPGYSVEPIWVDMADLDRDGDNEIVVLNYGLSRVALFFNNGNGTFEPPVNYTVPLHPRVVLAQDVNGDENIDLVVASQSDPDPVYILYNNGSGVFDSTRTLPTESALWDVRAADLDGDGLLDLVASNSATNKFSVFINIDDTGYAAVKTYATNTGPHIMQPADLDGDDDVDLAIANFTSNNVSFARNIGKGTFEAGNSIATGSGPNSVVAAYLNEDSYIDLATVNQISKTITVLLGNGNGSFQPGVMYSAYGGDPFHITAGDVDLDNDMDLIFIDSYIGYLVILPNNGNGSFGAAYVFAVGSTPEGVDAADLDGDDDIDIVVANRYDNTISIFFNNMQSDINDDNDVIPREFTLGQNYPNPFNPGTRIDFSLERRTQINISIFNILGQEVINLIDESRPTGTYSAYWNGTDDAGREMPSGIYFYRLRTKNQTEIRKMMLLK